MLVLLAGLCRCATASFIFAPSLLVGVVFIPIGLSGKVVEVQTVFTVLSLSWPLIIGSSAYMPKCLLHYTHCLVGVTRIQVRWGQYLVLWE